MVNLQVEISSGEAGAERILRFRLGEHTHEVAENLDQWHGEGYRYFKVRTADNSLYILRLDETCGDWDLTMFKTPPSGISKALHQR